MHRNPLVTIAVVCCLSLIMQSTTVAEPAGFKILQIGDAAPDFQLPGVDGKDQSSCELDADFSKQTRRDGTKNGFHLSVFPVFGLP